MSDSSSKHLVIRSIGTASPRDAARVALGLGVEVPEMVRTFYQAPTTLVENLPGDTAVALAELLRSLGCEIDVVDPDAPPPEPVPLLDVAVRVTEEDRFGEIAAAAADFLGCPEEEAHRLLLAAPPVLMGRVSDATVAALRTRLGEGADVLTSDPRTARYDLLLGDCPAPVRARLVADLRARGHDPIDEGPWLVRGLDRGQADGIWAAHRRTPTLQLADQDFYRFEVVLDGGRPDEAATAVLTSIGIPVGTVPRLFGALPVIIAEELSETAAEELLAELAAAGLEAHADLATFQQLGVHVSDWASPRPAREALAAAGISEPPETTPFTVGPWPDLTARLVRAMLRRTGAEAHLTDAAEVGAAHSGSARSTSAGTDAARPDLARSGTGDRS